MKIYAHFGILLAFSLLLIVVGIEARAVSDDDAPEEVPSELNSRGRRAAAHEPSEDDVPQELDRARRHVMHVDEDDAPEEPPQRKRRSANKQVDEDDAPNDGDVPQEIMENPRIGRNRRATFGKDDIPNEFPREIPEELQRKRRAAHVDEDDAPEESPK